MRIAAVLFVRVFIYSFFSLMAVNTWAQVMTESTDAGNTLATALPVPAGTIQINGTIGPDAFNSVAGRVELDVDMYSIAITTGGTFTIQANATTPGEPDMNLMVFNDSGQFLAGDDDDNSSCTTVVPFLDSLDTCLTLTLAAGTYYFAVGDNNIGAFSSVAAFIADRGDYFEDDDSGILGSPSAETVAIAGAESSPPSDPEERGPYIVYFSRAVAGGPAAPPPPSSGTPIPTMSAYGLVLTMLGLLLMASRRLKVAIRQKQK